MLVGARRLQSSQLPGSFHTFASVHPFSGHAMSVALCLALLGVLALEDSPAPALQALVLHG